MSTKFNEEKFLKTLFNEAAEEPSTDFAKLLMEKVTQEKQKNTFLYAPVMGWKGWTVFATLFLALLIFALSNKSSESANLFYDQLATFNTIYSSINTFPAAPLIYIGVVASAILILLDFFIRKKRNVLEK